MFYINKAITTLFDLLLMPFGALPAAAGLVFVSVLAGLLMLVVFKKTSNQRGLRAARDRMQGRLYEMRLFGGDPVATLRAAGAMLADNARYLRFMLVPLLVMLVPFAIICVQLEARYGLRPAAPGEGIIVAAKLPPGGQGAKTGAITLQTAGGAHIETAPLRIPSLGETNWRISAGNPGVYELKFDVAGDNRQITKTFVVGERVRLVSPLRDSGGVLSQAIHPGEPPSGTDAVRELRIYYPPRQILIAGRQIHWLIIFFAVSLVAAFAFKKVFRVEF